MRDGRRVASIEKLVFDKKKRSSQKTRNRPKNTRLPPVARDEEFPFNSRVIFQNYRYDDLFPEINMVKPNLANMSVEALLNLRADVDGALSRRAKELESQLSRLGGEISSRRKTRRSSLKGRKVAVKYRDKSGNTWAGRGAMPVWLREKINAGAKLQNFAVHKGAASRKKAKKRRKAKR